MSEILRLRKHLADEIQEVVWPAGVRLRPLLATDPERLHALLAQAYTNGFGSVRPLLEWWPAVTSDEDYEADLVFVVVDRQDQPIGLALCWKSGFIKDLAVAPAWRGKGLSDALVASVFNAFRQRGLPHVDLKVIAGNASARRFYQRMGMVEVPL